MNEVSELHFDRLCRACMQEVAESTECATTTEQTFEKSVQWQSIYNTVPECGTLQIAELLSSTTPQIQANLSDELPQKICHECLEQLLNTYRFQKMCIQSDHQMREILAKRQPDIKMITSAPLLESIMEPKVFSVAEPVNTLLEAQLTSADDPLQSVVKKTKNAKYNAQSNFSEFLKIEPNEFDICNDGYTEPRAMLTEDYTTDSSIKAERASPTVTQVNTTMSNDGSSKEDADSDWANVLSKSLSKKAINHEKSDVKSKIKMKRGRSVRNEQEHLSSSTHSCNLCNKTFASRRLLLRHLKRHKKADEQKCVPKQPGSKYSTKNVCVSCEDCGRQYSEREALYKHKLTHSEKPDEEKPNFACDFCDKTYTSQRTLTRHKRQRHSEENSETQAKLFVCEFCNKSFQQSGTLKDHIRTHTGEQPYLCSECGKAFNSSSNMKQHLLRHTGVKRYECPDCPKKFPCLSDLASHKAVHRQNKPHVCDVCGAAFGKPYQLKKHKMYHNGEKPYKCEYCEMRFVCMDHQRRHMRTHTGEKPYKCKYCDRAFAQSNDLIKHLRTHLGENVYKCELCPRAFRLAAELRVHFAMHKNDDEETRARNMQTLMEEETKLRLSLSAKYDKSQPAVL